MRAAELPKSRRRRVLPADAAMAAAILLLGLILAGTGGRIVQRWRSSSARHESLGFEDQLGIVANTAGLIVTALVGHVPCHCGRGGAPGTVREGPRRIGCGKVRPRLHAPPRPGRRRTPAAHSTARHGIHRAAGPGRDGLRTGRCIRWPRTPDGGPGAPPAVPPGTSVAAHPQWRPLSPVIEPGPLAGRPLRLEQPAGQGTEVTVRPGDSLWTSVRGQAGALRLRRRHRRGLAPALPGQQGRHRRQSPPPAAGPDTQDSARPLT